jgi:hypothetical protein
MRPAIAAAIGLGDDRGMPCCRPHLGLEAERRDILRKMIGSRLAIASEGRIGRDRLDPQQRKQPLEAVVEIGVDVIENRLDLWIILKLPLAVGLVIGVKL